MPVLKIDKSKFQKQLLAWYQKSARELPWRKTRDPYKIWVSEIMLQQTQVDTVIPYYEKWIIRFPDIKTLAKADLQDVLAAWAGLGYYRRARMIHQAALEIMEKHGGKIPETVEGLRTLPGIGRYSAGAIASIAYGLKAPIVDGNVIRILTRVWGIKDDVSNKSTIEKIWKLAEDLVLLTPPLSSKKRRETFLSLSPCEKSISSVISRNAVTRDLKIEIFQSLRSIEMTGQKKSSGREQNGNGNDNLPGDFNQAMMELGATVCFPFNPQCGVCPVSALCQARKEGKPEQYPFNSRKEKITKKRTAALLLRKKDSVLVQRQSQEGRWGGLWMFPHWSDKKTMVQSLKLGQKDLRKRLVVRHGFTRYQIDLEVYEMKTSRILDSALFPEEKWVPLSKLSSLPLPAPHQKIMRHLLEKSV